MNSYPVEFRLRVIELTEDGMEGVEIAEVLGVSLSWVNSIKRLHWAGLPLQPKSRSNKRKPLALREEQRIRNHVAEHPGTTLGDLKRELNLSDSISNIWNALHRLGLTLKKKRFARPNKIAPTSKSSAPPGTSCKRDSIHGGSFSSTKPSAQRP